MAAAIVPLCGLPLVGLMRQPARPRRKGSPQFAKVAGAIWAPGVAVALSGVGFGAISTFVALLYAARG